MKNTYVILICLLIGIRLCSAAETGKIVFIRANTPLSNDVQDPAEYKVLIGDSLVADLENFMMAEVTCPLGVQSVRIKNFKNFSMSVPIRSHETTYVQFFITYATYGVQVQGVVLENDSALEVMANAKMKVYKAPVVVKTGPNRFGVQYGNYFAYGEAPLYKNIDGNAYFSYENRKTIGLIYGREFGSFLDLEAEAAYCMINKYPMVLSPKKYHSVEGVLDGLKLSITSSFRFAFDSRRQMVFKFGAGPDVYLMSGLSWKSDASYWFNSIWNYGNSIGCHVRASFDWHFNKNVSLGLGYNLECVRFHLLSSPIELAGTTGEYFYKGEGDAMSAFIRCYKSF